MKIKEALIELNNLNEEVKTKHLQDIIKSIDKILIVNNVNDYHFSTNEDLREEYDDLEIYPEENLLNLTDQQLLELDAEYIHSLTNTQLLERIYKLDRDKLSVRQLNLLKNYYTSYRVIVDSNDIDYFLKKLKECQYISIEERPKDRSFRREYNLSDSDCLDILKQLKPSDYIENRRSINLGHLGDNLMVFQPSTIVINDDVFENLIIYIKIDVDETYLGDVVSVVSIHQTNTRDSWDFNRDR